MAKNHTVALASSYNLGLLLVPLSGPPVRGPDAEAMLSHRWDVSLRIHLLVETEGEAPAGSPGPDRDEIYRVFHTRHPLVAPEDWRPARRPGGATLLRWRAPLGRARRVMLAADTIAVAAWLAQHWGGNSMELLSLEAWRADLPSRCWAPEEVTAAVRPDVGLGDILSALSEDGAADGLDSPPDRTTLVVTRLDGPASWTTSVTLHGSLGASDPDAIAAVLLPVGRFRVDAFPRSAHPLPAGKIADRLRELVLDGQPLPLLGYLCGGRQ